jgi:GT2 family glycosyltransferase
VLDADILVDRDFLARNLRRLRAGEHVAHIPYRDCYSLDGPATARAVRERCEQGHPDVPAEVLRALVLRDPPGGCLWTSRTTFDAVGGYDERYVGWGGEDDDMWARFTAAGPVRRYDDQFLHLHHPRPTMVLDGGEPINAHLKLGTWVRDHGYGRLDGPSSPPDGAGAA